MLNIIEGTSIFRDRRLAARIAGGDRKAVEEFIDSYGSRIHALAKQYTPNGSDADDLAQEIFIDIFRCIGGFQGKSRLSTWMYRVSINHCLRYREKNSQQSVPYDDALVTAGDEAGKQRIQGNPYADNWNPESVAERDELKDKVHTAINKLSDEHRDVVILHELHGLTYQECADALGIPVGTVKSRLSNAFKKLRTSLHGYVVGEDSVLQKASETL